MGRAPNAVLRLDDPLVSGRHAILFIKEGVLHIADQGSSNGVFVNGHRVSAVPVGPLDEIRIGDSRLKIEAIGDMVDDEIPSPERTHAGLEISIGPDLAASAPGTIELSPELAPAPPAAAPRVPPPLEVEPEPAEAAAPMAPPPMAPPALPGAKATRPAEAPPPAAAHVERTGPHEAKVHDAAAPGARSTPAPTDHDAAARERTGPHAAKAQDAGAVPLPPPPPPGKRPAKRERDSNIAAMLLETNEELALSEAKKAPPPPAPAPAAPIAPVEDDGLPYPPSRPEVDEEAEEERRFTAPFSLLDAVVLDKGDPGRGATLVAEVLRHRGDRLVDATRLDGGAIYEIYRGEDAKAWRMLQVLRGGKIRLFFREGDEGTILVGGRKTALSSFCDDAHLFHKKRKVYALELTETDRAQLWIDGAGYFVRFARAPLPPPKKLSLRVSAEDRRYLMVGVAGIVLMLAGIWVQSLLAPPELLVMEQAEFAEISLKDLEMEKPPEPEPPPKVPEPVAEVQAPAPEPVKPAPAPPRPTKSPPAKVARGNPQPSQAPAPSAADSALAALADIAPAGDTKLTAAVSNIAAVRAPSGTSSSFQVSGAIGKVPGDEVTLSRGGKAGGEGRETRAASAVLAGKSVGQVAGGGGTGRVRGTVSRQPARSVGTSGGSLDRGAILKVINEHLSQVQSCYERELIANPGLQGKIEFDWVIGTEGSVTSTRVNSSSLASQAVANCIGSAIKTWQFPKPTGGSVSVRYPFVFSVQGF